MNDIQGPPPPDDRVNCRSVVLLSDVVTWTGPDVKVEYRAPYDEGGLHEFRFYGGDIPSRKTKLPQLLRRRARLYARLVSQGVELPIEGDVVVRVQVRENPNRQLDLDNVLKGVFRVLDGGAHPEHQILVDDRQVVAASIIRVPRTTRGWIPAEEI